MDAENKVKLDWPLIFIIAGAIIFYLPFISKNFMVDDWLWLSNARKALSNPAIFFQRPMYGYLRPFNMIVVAILYKIVGLNPTIFSLGNILLHVASIFLLSEVLKSFKVADKLRYLSCFIFAFYYLNAPAIAWISVGHDLWVTCLTLLFVIQIIKVFQRPSLSGFLLAWGLAFSAVMFKESGYVTLGLYFTIAILMKQSPFKGRFKLYTAIFISTFFAYLIYYALTRTYADKQLVMGLGTIVNLWYFSTHIFFPLVKRIVDIWPVNLLIILKLLKIIITLSIPLLGYIIFRKAPIAVKFFFVWIFMQISTIAIMKWDVGLFGLYTKESAARFFHTADVGAAVVLAWVISYIVEKLRLEMLSRRRAIIGFAAIFVFLNIGMAFVATKKYSERQSDSTMLINDLRPLSTSMANGDTLVILTNKKNIPPESIVESDWHIEAIVFMEFNKSVKVTVNEKPGYSLIDLSIGNRKNILGWDASKRHLILPAVN